MRIMYRWEGTTLCVCNCMGQNQGETAQAGRHCVQKRQGQGGIKQRQEDHPDPTHTGRGGRRGPQGLGTVKKCKVGNVEHVMCGRSTMAQGRVAENKEEGMVRTMVGRAQARHGVNRQAGWGNKNLWVAEGRRRMSCA